VLSPLDHSAGFHEVHPTYPNGVTELSPGLRGLTLAPTELPWVNAQKNISLSPSDGERVGVRGFLDVTIRQLSLPVPSVNSCSIPKLFNTQIL